MHTHRQLVLMTCCGRKCPGRTGRRSRPTPPVGVRMYMVPMHDVSERQYRHNTCKYSHISELTGEVQHVRALSRHRHIHTYTHTHTHMRARATLRRKRGHSASAPRQKHTIVFTGQLRSSQWTLDAAHEVAQQKADVLSESWVSEERVCAR
jgi:hypothetical protein